MRGWGGGLSVHIGLSQQKSARKVLKDQTLGEGSGLGLQKNVGASDSDSFKLKIIPVCYS